MPTDKGININGHMIPWAVHVAIVSAIVAYGILLGQVMQIDARLARVESAVLGHHNKSTTTERTQSAQNLVDGDARRDTTGRMWQGLTNEAAASPVRGKGTREGGGKR